VAKAPKAAAKSSVVPLRPEWLDVEEQRAIARERARVDLPTRQRDFSELWEEKPKGKKLGRTA
jgi:hypothetical protein